MKFGVLSASVLAVLLPALVLLRLLDERADAAKWRRLAALQPATPMRFDPTTLVDLPETAQRLFKFAIAPGTPLLSVVEIEMGGQFSLGTRDAPRYRRMLGEQILAAPHGFLWRVRLPGWVPVSGSDAGSPSESWTRFRILGLLPVARMGNDENHLRSAYGRYVAEAVFWTPAALLPGPGIRWDEVCTTDRIANVPAGDRKRLSRAADSDGVILENEIFVYLVGNRDHVRDRRCLAGVR